MNRFKFLAGVAVAASAISGCGNKGAAASGNGYVPKPQVPVGSAFVPAGKEASYFPLAVGNQWTFASTRFQTLNGRQEAPLTQEITYRITQIHPAKNGGTDAYFQIQNGDDVVDRQVWRIDSTGIYQVSLGKKLNAFSTPQMVMPVPVKVGAKFNWKGTVKTDSGEVRQGTNEGKVDGEEPIDSQGGNYNALKIESTGNLNSVTTKSKVASVLWLIPNVGIGRYRQEAIAEITSTDPKFKGQKLVLQILQTMKLKNFSPKK